MQADRETDRRIDRRASRQTSRWTVRYAGRRTDRQTGGQSGRQTDGQIGKQANMLGGMKKEMTKMENTKNEKERKKEKKKKWGWINEWMVLKNGRRSRVYCHFHCWSLTDPTTLRSKQNACCVMIMQGWLPSKDIASNFTMNMTWQTPAVKPANSECSWEKDWGHCTCLNETVFQCGGHDVQHWVSAEGTNKRTVEAWTSA